ncbi:2-phospho-L-lactate guanylyltransferase [Haloprofundus marisrubri]|uniref:2-phospho-L-lactate guanylyltransferase n=1 Tax=Haloprofundus marisrubri TaxID=1514971 RepID=A0A0W1R6T2_9EURY|nr:2-phospho-L-lactate guanylyltransferase [Haloprofundus marisrubri]KTG09134.1 2-phospho-L-lactate guanylyltransferase [Haloprofundus marisrubri]
MAVLVPYAAARPKTRLSDFLDSPERVSFSRAMLADVVDAVVDSGGNPTVLATEPVELDADATVEVDDRPLSTAVNDRLAAAADDGDDSTAVVMSDLALATPRVLSRFFDADGDLVVAPGRGGGTNALVVRHPEFRVDYHGTSYLDHLRVARDIGASVREFDSMRLSTDIDEPEDLVEVLLHTDGRARDWLLDAGFTVDVRKGRVGVRRER